MVKRKTHRKSMFQKRKGVPREMCKVKKQKEHGISAAKKSKKKKKKRIGGHTPFCAEQASKLRSGQKRKVNAAKENLPPRRGVPMRKCARLIEKGGREKKGL